jgi:uncharacterized protein (TIRG00374 family)
VKPESSSNPDTAFVQLRSGTVRRLWTAAAFAIAALLLYLAVRGVSWTQVAATIRDAQISLLLFAFVLGTLSYALRALRWKIVLSAGAQIDFRPVFWATSAGYLGNNFLPARAGEVIRSAMISRNSGLTTTYVLTTALAERALDLAILLVLSGGVVAISGRAPAGLVHAGAIMLGVAVCVLLVLAIVPPAERFWMSLLHRAFFLGHWRETLLRVLEQIVLGMRAFHGGRRVAAFVLLTPCIWGLDAFGATVVGRSLGIHITWESAFVLLAGLALGSMLPSTPGYVGVFQFVTVTILQAYGVKHSQGLTYSLVLQAASYVVITFWGLIGIWRYRTLTEEGSASRESDRLVPL